MTNHDGGDLLDDRALILGLDSQDDDVDLTGQGHVRGRGVPAEFVGEIAGLGGRAVGEDQCRGIDAGRDGTASDGLGHGSRSDESDTHQGLP